MQSYHGYFVVFLINIWANNWTVDEINALTLMSRYPNLSLPDVWAFRPQRGTWLLGRHHQQSRLCTSRIRCLGLFLVTHDEFWKCKKNAPNQWIKTAKEVWITMLHITTYSENIYQINIFINAFNTLRPRQMAAISETTFFNCIFLNEDIWISINISLRFVSKVRINNVLTLVQIMAWCRPGVKPLSESAMVIGIDHDTICAGVVGTAIRNSTSCAGRRAAACDRAGRHNECCSGLQY